MNIAQGKPYTMSPKPVYPGCTDDGDTTDLTDGRVHNGEDALWGQKGAVGWVAREPVHVMIDLGQVEPIMGASVHAGAGEASVAWPCSIAVEVSDDGDPFYLVGDLVRLDENPPPAAYQGYTAHTYCTTKLETYGRYVRFEFLPPSQYVFIDEIEVYRGEKSFLEITHDGNPVTSEHLLDESRLTRIGCHRRIRADLEAVNALVNQRRPVNADQLSAGLDRIRAELEASRFPADIRSFRAIVPYNELHRQVFEVYSELLPKQDESGLSIWHTPRYQMLSLFETPASPISALNIKMMQNERRAEVLNITNTSSEEKQISLRIADLPADIEYAREALDHCDIFCPNLSRYVLVGERIQSYFQQAQAEGRPFWFYQCHGPTLVFNPSYYRLQSWYARKYGATGVAFWAYADGGKNPNSWNEYPAVGAAGFTPVYFSADDVTTTKHWEALLEGRQDYQYVNILRDRVDALRRSGRDAESLQEAERLADELADSVIDHLERAFGRWYAAGLRDNPSAIAEEARLKVLDMLEVLLKIT